MDLIVALDTNAYCDFRSSGLWRDMLAQADRVLIPAPVIGELMHGFRLGKNFKLHKAEMEDFLKEPQVEVVPITKRTGEIYGEILDHLQKMDIPVPTNDIWISAIAIEHYALLLTSDPHFTAIPNLKLNTPDD